MVNGVITVLKLNNGTCSNVKTIAPPNLNRNMLIGDDGGLDIYDSGDESYIAVNEYRYNYYTGAVHIFKRNLDETWQYKQMVLPVNENGEDDSEANAYYGQGVTYTSRKVISINSNYLVVSAPLKDVTYNSHQFLLSHHQLTIYS